MSPHPTGLQLWTFCCENQLEITDCFSDTAKIKTIHKLFDLNKLLSSSKPSWCAPSGPVSALSG